MVVFAHYVEEKHKGQGEGEEVCPVPPFLKYSESGGIDMKCRVDDAHGGHKLEGIAMESAESQLRVVLGDLIDLLFHFS